MPAGSHQIATTGTISGVSENTTINNIAAALATMSQGGTAPTATSTGLSSVAGLWWHNTSDGTIRVRNQADTAWVTIGTINETTGVFSPAGSGSGTYLVISGGTLTGALTVQSGGVSITAGGLTVTAGGATITGASTVTGTVHITGAATFDAAASFGAGISVAGQIYSTGGGFKFPDGSVQTSAVSTSGFATTASLAAYAPLASPALTGTPTAPTPPNTDSSHRLATTDFVHSAILEALASYAASGIVTGGGADGSGGAGSG
jgi:hypothetical protein